MGEVSNGFAHFAFVGRRASRNMPGAADPNHELTLVMTKERAGVMAELSVLPLSPISHATDLHTLR